MPPLPFEPRYNAGRLTTRPCAHAVRGMKPCNVALNSAGVCLYHGGEEDRQADLVAAEQEAKAAAETRNAEVEALAAGEKASAERRQRRIRALACLLLLPLGWFGWQFVAGQQHDTGCASVREEARLATQKWRAVGIPLTQWVGDSTSGAFPATEQGIKDAYARRRQLAVESSSLILSHEGCFEASAVSEARTARDSPPDVAWVSMPGPPRCADGWISPSIGRQGACSHHGGVVYDSQYAVLHFASASR